MIEKIILSAIIALTPNEKKVLNNLQNRLEKQGYNISQYIEDPRFEIYNFNGGGKAINYADTTQSWYMRPDSIEKCADFIKEQYHWLKKTEKKFGIPPEHLVSQLQLETRCGQYTGEYPVINALISRYVRRPDLRNKYYKYISDFLDLVADTTDNIILPRDIFEIKGSWAGAYGNAQGMPDMIKKYGRKTDGDGDGKFDPINHPDAFDFMGGILDDNGFRENPNRATQRYNPGDPFYPSSVEQHKKELEKIMEKKRRIPPERLVALRDMHKFSRNIAPKMHNPKPIAKFQLPQKQVFLKRIFTNNKSRKKTSNN